MSLLFISISSDIDPDVYRVAVSILIVLLALAFLLSILKNILEYKLKNKILEKGISDDSVISSLLKDANNARHSSIKWVLILLAIGIGLFITKMYLPLGIHSIGIMAISLAAAYLAYFFYLNRLRK